MTKRCKKCGNEYPLDAEYWPVWGQSRDGFHYICIKCVHHKRLHLCWYNMIRRCYDPDCPGYENYGGRGIEVCEEWKSDSYAFDRWALANGYDDTLTIDRIEPDGNYTPENCRWANRSVQSMNRTTCNATGYIGVNVSSDGIRYYGALRVGLRRVSLEMARTPLEAAIIRDRYIVEHGLQNKLNGVLQ